MGERMQRLLHAQRDVQMVIDRSCAGGGSEVGIRQVQAAWVPPGIDHGAHQLPELFIVQHGPQPRILVHESVGHVVALATLLDGPPAFSQQLDVAGDLIASGLVAVAELVHQHVAVDPPGCSLGEARQQLQVAARSKPLVAARSARHRWLPSWRAMTVHQSGPP